MMMNKARLEPEEIRKAIVKAALDVANNRGWDAVTVRRVADEIGYAAPIIYQYFSSKKAMLRAIAEDGYEQLGNEIRQAAISAEADNAQRFRAIGMAYYTFAKRNFPVYQLMHEPLLYGEPDEPMVSADALFEFMCQEMNTLAGASLSPNEAVTRTFQAWSTMHGLIMIEANCSFKKGLLHPTDVIERFGEDFLQAIKRSKK
jgi:AcrR family transcriptional regulator